MRKQPKSLQNAASRKCAPAPRNRKEAGVKAPEFIYLEQLEAVVL